jgi:hypothetical protein
LNGRLLQVAVSGSWNHSGLQATPGSIKSP